MSNSTIVLIVIGVLLMFVPGVGNAIFDAILEGVSRAVEWSIRVVVRIVLVIGLVYIFSILISNQGVMMARQLSPSIATPTAVINNNIPTSISIYLPIVNR